MTTNPVYSRAMPKPQDPNKLIPKLKALAKKHGWVLARWRLISEDEAERRFLRSVLKRNHRWALLNPKMATPAEVRCLIRKGLFDPRYRTKPRRTAEGRKVATRIKQLQVL